MEPARLNSTCELAKSFQPIFILSYGRSGSTLLRYILDSHPQIACPAEINLGILCDSLFHTIFYTVGQLQKHSISDEVERVSLIKTREIVMSLMNEYARAKGKSLWCERSPLTLDYLLIIDKLFPDAKYLCLYRNCIDFSSSYLTLNRFAGGDVLVPYVHRNPTSILSAVVDYWADKSELLMTYEEQHSRQCMRIRYEDLVTDPQKTLEIAFSFLNVEWNVDILDSAFRKEHDDGPGDIKIRYTDRVQSDSIGKGVNIPYNLISKSYLARINYIHNKLGYWTVENFYKRYSEKSVATSSTATSVRLGLDSDRGVFDSLAYASKHFKALEGECGLVVTGPNGGSWICSPTAPYIREAKVGEATACRIVVEHDVLIDILSHKVNPIDAHSEGRLRMIGDFKLAEQLGRALLGS
jgi:protein-tyrosine sulfotransferase